MERARIGTGQIEGYSESDAQKLVDFFSLQSNTCRSFKFPVDKDMDNAVDECSKQIAARTAYAVWLAACSGDADSCLELGMRSVSFAPCNLLLIKIRMYAGCGASQDRDAALDWWRRISDPTYPSFIKSSSRPLKARALACLANAYYEKCCLPNQTLQIDDLYRAAQLANAAASWGLTSPIVLSVGNRVEKFGLRRQADCQFKGVDTSRFEAFEFLWKVVDARSEQLKKVREKRDAKVLQAPNLYVCAREGCGIEGTSRSALQQCSGKCPLDAKPSYCSRECQKAVSTAFFIPKACVLFINSRVGLETP